MFGFDNVEQPKEEAKEIIPQEEKKPSEKELALLRSQQMLDKFESNDEIEKSFEIEVDAVSVNSDIQIIDDPIIAVEDSEKIQVKEAPEDSNVLI